MSTTQQKAKPDPEIGMIVTWVEPESLNNSDAEFLRRSPIRIYGKGRFKVCTATPYKSLGATEKRWHVTLTKNGRDVYNDPTCDPNAEPEIFNWEWLRPIIKKNQKFQIGALVTWSQIGTAGDDVKDADKVIRDLVEEFGVGPFIVAIQNGSLVDLIHPNGIPLIRSGSNRNLEINQCFVEPV